MQTRGGAWCGVAGAWPDGIQRKSLSLCVTSLLRRFRSKYLFIKVAVVCTVMQRGGDKFHVGVGNHFPQSLPGLCESHKNLIICHEDGSEFLGGHKHLCTLPANGKSFYEKKIR